MSSKSGHFWSSTVVLRLRSLLQLFHKTENCHGGGGGGRRSSPPPQSSVAMLPYTPCYNQPPIYPMFRLFGSYFTSATMKLNREKDQSSTPYFFFPGWVKWIFGSLLSLLIPTWKQSSNKLQTLEGEAEMVIEEAESVAEVVEKAAEIAEKASAEIAKKLPEKSKLKEAAEVVETYSKQIAHDAHLTQDILHKVEEWKQKLDKSETAINEQIRKKEGPANK
ncbi:uncharacterized protein LOC111012212 [Momordica charantia]|uniref:Uncharacterized protein LOC111012212 n=1 Tax=Momordica charantia TaxID=3673 RepID=A0A6J1CKS7_MOMCH|nr:uncharacterized protein LOC111012212 [Momordica charantia]